MKNGRIPLFIIVGSMVLIVANIMTSEIFDGGFWLRVSSSMLLIIAMFVSIRKNKKQNSKGTP